MEKSKLIKQINDFREEISKYRKLLLLSTDDLGDIAENHKKLPQIRTNLIKVYAGLEDELKKFGRDPHMQDPVWKNIYSAYDNALSSDILQRRGRSIDAILTDLDYILGKLQHLSNDEIQNIIITEKIKKQRIIKQELKHINYWDCVNPFWLLWQLLKVLWKHKIISGIIVGLIVTYLAYKFGWVK